MYLQEPKIQADKEKETCTNPLFLAKTNMKYKSTGVLT